MPLDTNIINKNLEEIIPGLFTHTRFTKPNELEGLVEGAFESFKINFVNKKREEYTARYSKKYANDEKQAQKVNQKISAMNVRIQNSSLRIKELARDILKKEITRRNRQALNEAADFTGENQVQMEALIKNLSLKVIGGKKSPSKTEQNQSSKSVLPAFKVGKPKIAFGE